MSRNLAVGIYPQETEQQNGESQERRATVAEERQRNTYNRYYAYYHAYVYCKMEKEYRGKGIAVGPSKDIVLPFGKCHQAQYEHHKEYEYEG